MARRVPQRWQTTFGAWVNVHTVPTVAAKLADAGHPINPRTVYDWLSGRSTPRLYHATALVSIAGGALRIEDIVAHKAQARTEPNARTRP